MGVLDFPWTPYCQCVFPLSKNTAGCAHYTHLLLLQSAESEANSVFQWYHFLYTFCSSHSIKQRHYYLTKYFSVVLLTGDLSHLGQTCPVFTTAVCLIMLLWTVISLSHSLQEILFTRHWEEAERNSGSEWGQGKEEEGLKTSFSQSRVPHTFFWNHSFPLMHTPSSVYITSGNIIWLWFCGAKPQFKPQLLFIQTLI